MAENIDQLVAALQEIYQPIYGYPKYLSRASRPCQDRLTSLTSIYRALEAKLNRSLRVLDLGCARRAFLALTSPNLALRFTASI